MKKSIICISLITITVALAFGGCNRKTMFAHYAHTPLSGWYRSDTLNIELSTMRQSGAFDEVVALRTNSAYPFTSLTLIVDQEQTAPGRLFSDTITMQLTSANGTLSGKGVGYLQYEAPLRSVNLGQGSTLRFAIRHYMKREDLPGISDVGIILKRR